MPVETPEYLVGMGGGGSSIVERFMQKEWIINEVIDPEAGDPEPRLRARTIDSADSVSETNRRDSAEEQIQELIDEKKSAYSQEFVEVDFNHYNYVRDTEEGKTNKGPMTGKVDVNNLIDYAPGLDNCWWINGSDDLFADGFGSGVNRRRALSKALYHVSSVYSKNTNDHPSQLGVGSGDTAVIVVSPGGGTGSGSFINVADDMSDDANIHLFAVLPDAGHAGGQTESSDELASAYAALSELEYMELNDESPFTTITLIPYIEDSDIDDSDFEDAVVHTLLAYQNLWADTEAPAYLNPGMNNAINSYYSFNVAVPRIIEYDAGIRWKMQEDVNEYFEQRREQLEVEKELYKTVENYLTNNFHDSFYLTLEAVREGGGTDVGFDSSDEAQVGAVQAMRRRLEEDLQGSLLADNSLSVAGLPVEEIVSDFEDAYNDHFELGEDHDGPVYERVEDADTESVAYAEQIVEQLPQQIYQYVSPGQFEEGSARDLAGLVVLEAENIDQRRNLMQAIYETDPGSVEGLDEREIEHIKRALTEVVLDPDARALAAEFPKSEIESLKDDLWEQLCETEIQYVQLEGFEEQVTGYFEEQLSDWWTEAAKEFDILANYNAHREEIAVLVRDLDEACQRKANQLSDDAVNAENIRPQLEKEGGESVDIQELNRLLVEVGIEDGIDESDLRKDIRNLIQAKKAHNEANSGLLSDFLGDDKQTERDFNSGITRVSDRFDVVYEDIGKPFKVEFEGDYEETLLGTVDDRYQDAVEAAVDELEVLLTDDEGEIQRFAANELVDGETVVERVTEDGSATRPKVYLDSTGTIDITVPEDGTAVWELFGRLTETIESLDPVNIDDAYDIKTELGVGKITDARSSYTAGGDTDPDTIAGELLGLYLDPIRSKKDELAEELQRLGSDYVDEQSDGLYLSVARLIRLANERAANDDEVELDYPAASLGLDFTQTYDDSYSIETTESKDQRTENVFRRTRPASTRDLAGNPDDIAESLIWDNKRDDVIGEFVQSVREITSGDPRFPVDLGRLDPTEEFETSSQFQQLRIWNAYMSRVFEDTSADASAEFDPVGGSDGEVNKEELNKNRHDKNGYVSRRIGYGDEWTFSIVTFLSGFTLDMLTPVTANGGYKETYENELGEATYPWRNHSFGLEGAWDRWKTLRDRVVDDESPDWWPHGGAYVWREETVAPGDIAAWTLQVSSDDRDTADVMARLNEKYAVESFESTVEID